MEILLEAGTAFGSGAHPSTQLALHAMELLAANHSFSNILDIGCGSGVLSIAAAAFFGARVLATDLQAEALVQTEKNAALNQLGEQIATARADGPGGPETSRLAPYDLILCNVLAEMMLPWLRTLHTLLAADGTVCFSGILSWQAESFRRNLSAAGFDTWQTVSDGTWSAILAKALPSA